MKPLDGGDVGGGTCFAGLRKRRGAEVLILRKRGQSEDLEEQNPGGTMKPWKEDRRR